MITGEVSAIREASIRLAVRTSNEDELEVEMVIDTGFNGWISLPSTLIAELGLPWRRRGRGELADASETIFDNFGSIARAAPQDFKTRLSNCGRLLGHHHGAIR